MVGLRFGIERNEHVWKHSVRRGGTRSPDDVLHLAGDYGGFRVAEVLDQGMAAAVRGRVVEANHVLWVVLWWVQEDEALVDFRLVCR